jgi:integrase
MKLTSSIIAKLQLPPGKTDVVMWDDTLPGFGVRLRAGGTKTFLCQYRIGKKQFRLKLGREGRIDFEAARRAARKALTDADEGRNPANAKEEVRRAAALTLGSVVERYLEERARESLRPRSFVEVERHLRKRWEPLHGLPLAAIKRAEIAARIGVIKKTNGPTEANRSRAALSALYNWAIGEGLADMNLVSGTNVVPTNKARDRVLSNEELRAVWLAADEDAYGSIIKLLTLTAQRRDEVSAMTWDELDLDNATWVIPAERTKNHRAHEVPLSEQALAILKAIPKQKGRVFGTMSWSRAKIALDARIANAGAKLAPWRVHDIRRTAATRMADLGVQPHHIEAALNHVSGHKAGVAGVYNRAVYVNEKRRALELWAERVKAIIGGTSNVIAMKREMA